MNQKYIVIVACLMVFADAKSFNKPKFCKENEKCGKEECCIRGICLPFIPIGKGCDPMAQIMRLQCPCTIGSSCTLMDTFPVEEMLCEHIESPDFLEMIENRDRYHIESNDLED